MKTELINTTHESLQDENGNYYVIVKPETNWIYKGLKLKIINFKDADPEPELNHYGREFKLSLVDTPFENRYKNAPYTFIYEPDLIVPDNIPDTLHRDNDKRLVQRKIAEYDTLKRQYKELIESHKELIEAFKNTVSQFKKVEPLYYKDQQIILEAEIAINKAIEKLNIQ